MKSFATSGRPFFALRRAFLVLAAFAAISTATAADYGVTPAFYDDIGDILTSLGLAHDVIPETDLANYSAISSKRAIFINCSGSIDTNMTPAAVDSLRAYVANGGVVYASDWAFIAVKRAFGGYITFAADEPRIAPATVADGIIESPGMRDYMGVNSFTVDFNLGGWVPMASVDNKTVDVFLTGANAGASAAQYVNGKPILVKFDYGAGSVIYTSFHNEAGLGATAIRALEYMVLLSIMSRTATELANELRSQGYIPVKENIDILSVGVPKNFTYTHNSTHEEDLAFATRWRDTATIAIDASGPGAPSQNLTGATPSEILQFPVGANGTWNYSVTNNASSGDVPVVAMAAKRIAAFDSVEYVKVYPNPFKATEHDVMVFEGLTEEATIKIYSLSGQLVKTIRKNDSAGTVFWAVDNDSGEKVASGLYIWVAKGTSGAEKRGKLAVVR